MIKMMGSYIRPEELLTKVVNENRNLTKQMRELKEENAILKQKIEEQQMELEYARYYADEENRQEAVELSNLQLSDIVTYEEWFDTKEYNDLQKAYEQYYN